MTYLGDNELRSIAARTVAEGRRPHLQKLLDALGSSEPGDAITLPFDTIRTCCAELSDRTKMAALLATEVLEMRQAEPRAKLAVQCCANCQFRLPGRDPSGLPGGSDTPISVCAANPPNPVTRMVDGRQHSVGLFTEVQDDDWCGRWVRYSHRRVEA